MDAEDGRHFLLRRTNRSPEAAGPEAADQLVGVLGGHALALEQAGAYIRETGTSFADYLKLYEGNRRTLLDQHGALNDVHSEHPLTVAATFKASFAKVREITPLAEDILHFCAFIQPDAIPEELFQHDGSLEFGTIAFDKGIAALQRYSLIKRNRRKTVLVMHHLVQAVLIDSMDLDLQKQWQERVVRALDAPFLSHAWVSDQTGLYELTGYVSNEPYWETGELEKYERLVPHVWECADWPEEDESSTIEVDTAKARLSLDVGDYIQYTRGREATPLFTLACYLLDRHIEYPTVRTISALAKAQDDLALYYFEVGEYEWAENTYKEALETCVDGLGAEHSLTQEIRSNYAFFLYDIGRDSEAEALEADDEPPD